MKMNEKEEDYVKEVVETHWKYSSKIMEMMYREAFVHGFKHGIERAKELRK